MDRLNEEAPAGMGDAGAGQVTKVFNSDSTSGALIHRYAEAGFYFVHIPKVGGKPTKGPRNKGWNHEQSPANPNGYTNDPEQATGWLEAGDNLGVALAPSRLVDLDLDAPEAVEVLTGLGLPIADLLADPARVSFRSGKEGKDKLIFLAPEGVTPPPSRKLSFGNRSIFELRHASADGTTVQSVLPPSIHPDTGRPYQLVGDVLNIPALPPELLALWKEWPEAAMKSFDPEWTPPHTAPRKPKESIPDERDPITEFNAAHDLSDLLDQHGYIRKGRRYLRPGSESGIPGLVVFEAKDGRGQLCFSHGSDALADGKAHDSFDVHLILGCGGDLTTALAWNPEITAHNQRLYRERKKSENAHQGTANTADRTDWPVPKPIQMTLYPVPAFDDEALLPSSLREWAMDEADRMPCPPDFIAAAVMVELGSIVGARCAIRPKFNDDWLVVPNIWGGVVSPPSQKKSPAINSAMKPMDRLIAKAMAAQKSALDDYEIELTIHKAEQDALQDRIKKAAKGKGGPGGMQSLAKEFAEARENAPKPPTLRRFKTNDTSVEKLGELLRENPAGLMVLRDELVGLIASWEREGREGERAFYLEAWNGNSSFDTDRIGRGSIFIENLCVSIFGGIQPDKLVGYLEQAANALANDGMLQRFQVLVYPDPCDWAWRDRLPKKAARDRACGIVEAIAEMDPVAWGAEPADDFSKFPFFRFSREAQEVFIEWSGELHREKLPAEEIPIIAQHLTKYDKLFPAIALILHLVDVAETGQTGPVSKEAALRAAAWCEYLEAHARRCYGLLADDGLRAAQALSEKIQVGKLADGFTAREVRRNQWKHLTTDVSVAAALDWLEDEGWIRSQDTGGTGPGAGRRTVVYWINPALKGGPHG